MSREASSFFWTRAPERCWAEDVLARVRFANCVFDKDFNERKHGIGGIGQRINPTFYTSRRCMDEERNRYFRPSYNVVSSIDAFLSQVVRLAGRGYYFCFYNELKPGKDPEQLDRKLIERWELDKPYWKREKRRRGEAPSIWYLRYGRKYLLMATRGRSVERGREGEPHPFFEEYDSVLFDIRKHALYFCGYSIRYPRSKTTGKHQAFVRLDKSTYEQLRETMCNKAARRQYRQREAIEAEFSKLPWQRYGPVSEQLRRILKEVNRRRMRYHGVEPARASAINWRMRTVKIYEDDRQAVPKVLENRYCHGS